MGTPNVLVPAAAGKRCQANTRYELQRATAKLQAAVLHLERAFSASDEGLRPPIAVTTAEAQTAMDHARLVLRQTV
jgi:hypothetical protein